MYLLGYSHQIRTFNVDYSDLVNCYGISVSPIINNMLRFFRSHYLVIFTSVITYHWILIQINTAGVTSGIGTDFLSGAHAFTYSIQWRSFCSTFNVILSTIVCLFALFLLGGVLSVFRLYGFSYFQTFLQFIFFFLIQF